MITIVKEYALTPAEHNKLFGEFQKNKLVEVDGIKCRYTQLDTYTEFIPFTDKVVYIYI